VERFNGIIKHKNFVQTEGSQSSGSQPLDNGRVVDIDNEINSLKKKVNKITLKMQSFKEDMLTIRQDFNRELDVIKVTL